jgi:hypothetical protein
MILILSLPRQLQSSLRNALSSFGPKSTQYLDIKYMVDEYAAKLALENMSLSLSLSSSSDGQ